MINENQHLYAINDAANSFFSQKMRTYAANNANRYLYNRGINKWSIQQFSIGYCPSTQEFIDHMDRSGYSIDACKNLGLVIASTRPGSKPGDVFCPFEERIVFPVHNYWGNVCGFSGRILDESEKKHKYINSSKSPIYHKEEILYGFFQAKASITYNKRAIVVEGYMDVIPMHQIGFTETVACCGVGISEYHIHLFKMMGVKVIAMLDGDKAGEAGATRFKALAESARLDYQIAFIGKGVDPGEIAIQHGKNPINQAIRQSGLGHNVIPMQNQ